jgi:plastocyanin
LNFGTLLAPGGIRMLRPLALLSLFALAPACVVGDITQERPGPGSGNGDGSGDGNGDGAGGGGGPDEPPPATTSLQVLPADAQLTLGTSATFDVVVSAEHYAGPVELWLEGVPASWQVEFSPAELVFTGTGSQTATLEVTIPTNGDAGAMDAEVVAVADMGEERNPVSLAVDKVLVLPIADNTGAGAHGFPRDVALKAGTLVRFVNLDDSGASHRIHGPGGSFPHGDSNIPTGASYEVSPTGSGDPYQFYCHVHGVSTGIGSVIVSN